MNTDDLALTADDLPTICDQLDTIAEHDLDAAEGVDPTVADDIAEARVAIRKARTLLLQAAELLGVNGE